MLHIRGALNNKTGNRKNGLLFGTWNIRTLFKHEAFYMEIWTKKFKRQPEGFNVGTEKVCRLQRGLKQSSRCWNIKFKTFILNFNLLETKADPYVFINRENNKVLIVAIFVDDDLVAAKSNEDVKTLMKYLRQHFNITEEEFNQFLGTKIEQKLDENIFYFFM